jgi:hypothetical protein
VVPVNAVSEPPLTSTKPEKPVTFPDVAMRVAQDGPIYAVIGLVGAMALGGHATASEAVITGLAGLLARSWPRAVQVAGKASVTIVAAAVAFGAAHACVPVARPTAYGADLAACTASSSSCDQSIRCENTVRERYGRPSRSLDAGCD